MTRCVDTSISALVGARTYHLIRSISDTPINLKAQSLLHHLCVVGDDCREVKLVARESGLIQGKPTVGRPVFADEDAVDTMSG